jgi:hypothetical protein
MNPGSDAPLEVGHKQGTWRLTNMYLLQSSNLGQQQAEMEADIRGLPSKVRIILLSLAMLLILSN